MDKNKMYTEQEIQENEYAFPYHHIIHSQKKGSFQHCITYPYSFLYLNYLSKIKEIVSGIQFKSLLDVGCGDGYLLRYLDMHFSSKQFMGIDVSLRAVAFANAFQPKVKYVCGDVTTFFKGKEKYDVVTSIAVLEHVPLAEVESFFNAHHECLNAGGVLLLAVPSDVYPTTSKHFQHFNRDKIDNLISGKYRINKVYYQNNLRSIVTIVVQKVLFNGLFTITSTKILNLLYKLFLYSDKNTSEKNGFIHIYDLRKI